MNKKVITFWSIIILIISASGLNFLRHNCDINEYFPFITGKVIHKSEQLEQAKHSTNHNMYLTVDYGDHIRDVGVSTHCYLTTNIGDNVTFRDRRGGFPEDLVLILNIVCFTALVLGVFVLIIWGVIEFYERVINN